MKSKIFCLILAATICQSYVLTSQEPVFPENQQEKTKLDSSEVASLTIGNNLIHVEDSDSAFTFRIKDKGISILESLEGRKIGFNNYDTISRENEEYPEKAEIQEEMEDIEDISAEVEDISAEVGDIEIDYSSSDNDNYSRSIWERGRYDDSEREDNYRAARHFRGHLSGFEIGFNNFNYDYSNSLPDQIGYMELNTSASNCFNFNFSQVNIGFSRHIGIVSGLGLNWNNYRFEWDNTIGVGEGGTIVEMFPADNSVAVKKSKFATLYLNVPVLLEVQIPAGYNRLNIAAGVIGGVKLNAWTKLVFEDGNKSRTNGEYNLNILRGGVAARIGYENFMIYGTYYLSPWFKDGRGPNGLNLEPFEIGLSFTFND